MVLALGPTLPGVGGSPEEEGEAAIRPGLLPEGLPGEEATAARPAGAEAGATLQPYQAEVAERRSQEAGADPPRRSREEEAAEVGPTCMLL